MIRTLMICATLSTAALAVPMVALADEQPDLFVTVETDESFDDVTFAVESAILAQGLVIDSVSHTGDMLERTKDAVGSDVVLFTGADIYQFCSATVSRAVMEADPMNLRFCPYAIYVYQQPDGAVTVGHRGYVGTMEPVNALLDGIVKEALDLN